VSRRVDVSPKEETTMIEQKITPCLWFDFNAEEAVDHYLSIFPNSRILSTARYGEFASGQKGRGDDDFFRDRRPALPGAERRPAIQIHACHFADGELRQSG
jgi:hypothetical protein